MSPEEKYLSMMEDAKLKKSERTALKKKGLDFDRHHIKPKGSTFFPELSRDESNIVLLTPDEHVRAHVLLCEIYPNSGMAFALRRLLFDKRHVGTEEERRLAKESVSTYMKEKRRLSGEIRSLSRRGAPPSGEAGALLEARSLRRGLTLEECTTLGEGPFET
jgi:hypothetical protein